MTTHQIMYGLAIFCFAVATVNKPHARLGFGWAGLAVYMTTFFV